MKRIQFRSQGAVSATEAFGPVEGNVPGPFAVKDCALVAIATGERAQSLRELRNVLRDIHPGSVYYHFWGGLLRPRFDNPDYINDFAVWAYYGLHDGALAERLAVIDPTDYPSIEALREKVIDVIEERLDETETVSWSAHDNQFHFIRSQIVVFDTRKRIENPEALVEIIPNMSVGSVFYHFIDARRRSERREDDFRTWMRGLGDSYNELRRRLAEVDPYFVTLAQLRDQLANVFRAYYEGASQ